MRRVYVRAVGARTALGGTWHETVAALAEGRSAVQAISHFDVTGFPCTVGAPIEEDGASGDRRLRYARAAAREAWGAARVGAEPERIGVFVGAEPGRPCLEDVSSLDAALDRSGRFLADRLDPVQRDRLASHAAAVSPATIASALAREIGAGGPVLTISLACASGCAAVAAAARAIRSGCCDIALCGGTGAEVDAFVLAGFGLLGALSARGHSCPFDLRRDGFVLGEGAAMVVLSCEAGPAEVEVAGWGGTLDAGHLTAPDPGGAGAARAMQIALRSADLSCVDYVQAHGTSTPLNDAVEAAAIRRVLGSGLRRCHVSSVKGALGHCIAAAGAIGFLCAVEAVGNGRVLPTAGLREPDAECELPHVMHEAIHREARSALVNAFAFGGANWSIAVRRP